MCWLDSKGWGRRFISWVSSSRSTRLEQAAKRRLSSLLLPPLPPSSFVLSFSSPSATNPQNGFNSSLTSWTDRTSSRDRREEHPITACTAGTTESSRFALWELVRPWKAAGDRQCANANTTVTTAAPCLAPDTEDTTVVADCPGHTRWPRSRENTVAHTQHRRTPSSIVGSFGPTGSEMSPPTQKKAKISGGQPAAAEPEGFFLYEGGQVADGLRSKLKCVHIGPHVTRIEDGAFACCINLTHVQLNEGLQIIGECAFDGCVSLRSLTLPSTVTELGDSAFTGWLGAWAFSGCRSLVEVQLNEGLRTIGLGAFVGCTKLRSVTLPSTVTTLCQRVFYYCENLAEVRLNEGLQTIRKYAFSGCTALRSVTIPSTVTKLGKFVFWECYNLAEVHLDEGLKSIRELAFQDCTALRSVTIPSTVTKLGTDVFCGCNNLSEVILLGGQMILNQEFLA